MQKKNNEAEQMMTEEERKISLALAMQYQYYTESEDEEEEEMLSTDLPNHPPSIDNSAW
jgi:hypothetical protein